MTEVTADAAELGGTIPPTAADVIQAGKVAWTGLKSNSRQTWAGWIQVGQAVAIGRSWALAVAKTNEPAGFNYNKQFHVWLQRHALDDIDKSTRAALLHCIDNLPAIQAWRDKREPNTYLTHPKTVWTAWKRATTDGTTPRHKPALPASTVFNNASLAERRAFLAKIDVAKLSEALPEHIRTELQRRAGHKARPDDALTHKLAAALKVALSSAAAKTPESKNNALAAINGINNMLRGAGLDLHSILIVVNETDAQRAA